MKFHIKVLRDELSRRIEKNRRYSLRAFAKNMGLHPSSMSRILNGKQILSPRAGLRVMRKLELNLFSGRLFLKSIAQTRHENECEMLGRAIGKAKLGEQAIEVNEATSHKLASLPCVSLMELALTDDFHMNTLWMSERLHLPLKKVDELLDLLLQTGLVSVKEDRLVKTDARTTSFHHEKSCEVRKAHQQEVLDRATWSLKNVEFEGRCNQSMTMAIDPQKLPEAKRRVHEFMGELCDFLESGLKTEVFAFSAQLFPLTGNNYEQAETVANAKA